MDFARILAEAVARQSAPNHFADAVAAFEQDVARAAMAAPEVPAWARTLGVALPCTEHELRVAFRRRAFETHRGRLGPGNPASDAAYFLEK